MSEYIYASNGEPLANGCGEIALAIRGEVVRCRDCKYANEDGDECVYFAAWEPLPEGDEFRDVYVDVEPNGFCAWGIKK